MTPDSFDEPMDDTTQHTLPVQTQDAPTLEPCSIVCLPREHFTLYFTQCAALTDQRLLALEATERPNTLRSLFTTTHSSMGSYYPHTPT